MIKLFVFLNGRFSSTQKLKIMGSSLLVSLIILVCLNHFATLDAFNTAYMLLFIGNVVLWIYVYVIHNMKIDIEMLKQKVDMNEHE